MESFHLTSDLLENPQLIKILQHLSQVFKELNKDFFVIGAVARDIALSLLAGTQSSRKTRDLDLAVTILSWIEFEEIVFVLGNHGFEKDKAQQQRFYFGKFIIDVVPYGAISDKEQMIYWPPDGDFGMSVLGYDTILKTSISITIDNQFTFKIVTLAGLFLLKLNAWKDRHFSSNKDADDIWLIIENYYFSKENNNACEEVYELIPFTLSHAGAYLLALDAVKIVDSNVLLELQSILDKEITKGDESILISQILETHITTNYDEIIVALKTISKIFLNHL